MKTVTIFAISGGFVVATLLGIAVGMELSQQAVLEENIAGYKKSEEQLQKTIEIEKMEEKTTLPPPAHVSKYCSGSAGCFEGKVTSIIDGDTIEVDGKSIRFALASAPELNELGGTFVKNFVSTVCPVGSKVVVDEDDYQTQGSYGRMVGTVYCNNVNLNQAILETGFGEISTSFCNKSEFGSNSWAQKNGCGSSMNYQPSYNPSKSSVQTSNCDPNYSGVCIPINSPDLDCSDFSGSVKVVGSDKHGLDRDGDGIGCE